MASGTTACTDAGAGQIAISRRTVAASLILLAVGLGLVIYLAVITGIDLKALLQALADVDLLPFVVLVVVSGLYIFCGAEKWRLVDAVLRREGRAALSRETTFALTVLGNVLGYIFPLQLGMALTRTLGTYVTGHRAVVRGTLGTALEQAFDLLLVCVLAVVSVLALAVDVPPLVWAGIALLLVVSVGGAFSGLLSLVRKRVALAAADTSTQQRPRLARWLGDLEGSGLLEPKLARRLWTLSSIRFLLIIVVAVTTAWAAKLDISAWHIAGAMPLTSIATALSPTPAGLGVNEFSYVSLLRAFGTPLAVAAQWAIINRVLGVAASLVVLAISVVLVLAIRLGRGRQADDQNAA